MKLCPVVLGLLGVITANAANPSFQSFDLNNFQTNGNLIGIKTGGVGSNNLSSTSIRFIHEQATAVINSNTVPATNFWSVLPAFPAATQGTNWAINFGVLNAAGIPANEQALTTATNVYLTGPTNWYPGASMALTIYASGTTLAVFIPTNICGQMNNSDWTVLSTNYTRWITNQHAIHFTIKSNVQWCVTSVYPKAGQ